MGRRDEQAPIEIETTTNDGQRMILSLAPGYSREDAFAELPAIRQEVQQALTRLGRTGTGD